MGNAPAGLLAVVLGMIAVTAAAEAASVAKTYSYFAIGGTTLDELQEELRSRGPHVKSTGRRHPGATQLEFTTRLGYAEGERSCRIAKATVRVTAKVILPRWNRRNGAGDDVRLVWDTLSSDIRRHEESHVSIARSHARELEQALLAIWPESTCKEVAAKVQAKTTEMLKKHDEAQARFDRVEQVNFESRLLRLMRYRLEQSEKSGPARP